MGAQEVITASGVGLRGFQRPRSDVTSSCLFKTERRLGARVCVRVCVFARGGEEQLDERSRIRVKGIKTELKAEIKEKRSGGRSTFSRSGLWTSKTRTLVPVEAFIIGLGGSFESDPVSTGHLDTRLFVCLFTGEAAE